MCVKAKVNLVAEDVGAWEGGKTHYKDNFKMKIILQEL
jgi:hypothetical protein